MERGSPIVTRTATDAGRGARGEGGGGSPLRRHPAADALRGEPGELLRGLRTWPVDGRAWPDDARSGFRGGGANQQHLPRVLDAAGGLQGPVRDEPGTERLRGA